MLEIAVCEDTAAEDRVIAEYAEAFFEERGMEPGVYVFEDMDSLLDSDRKSVV